MSAADCSLCLFDRPLACKDNRTNGGAAQRQPMTAYLFVLVLILSIPNQINTASRQSSSCLPSFIIRNHFTHGPEAAVQVRPPPPL